MKQKHANQGPRFTTEVSEQEKQVAKSVKGDFKKILSELDDGLKIIYDFKDAILEERPSKDDLKNKYNGRILRYKRKIVKTFNSLLQNLKNTISSLRDILDPDMINLRGLIMAEFDELSDGIEGVLDLFDDVDSEGFTKKLERLCTQLQNRKTSIDGVIDSQMMSHIENDILGKEKVSEIRYRINRRRRIVRGILNEKM